MVSVFFLEKRGGVGGIQSYSLIRFLGMGQTPCPPPSTEMDGEFRARTRTLLSDELGKLDFPLAIPAATVCDNDTAELICDAAGP